MATKKPVKKPVAKKATVKKAATKAKTTAKKTVTKVATAKKLATKVASTRRPDSNQPPSVSAINGITNAILSLMTTLDNYTVNLRALDRQRHNRVGLKRLGFIEAAFRISTKFPQYFPHWLSTAAKKPSAFWLGVCA